MCTRDNQRNASRSVDFLWQKFCFFFASLHEVCPCPAVHLVFIPSFEKMAAAAGAEPVLSGEHDVLQAGILAVLGESESAQIDNSLSYASSIGVDHAVFVGVVKSLESRFIVATSIIEKQTWVVSAEGQEYVSHGTPEIRVFSAVPAGAAVPMKQVEQALGPAVFKVGQQICLANKWLRVDKGQLVRTVRESGHGRDGFWILIGISGCIRNHGAGGHGCKATRIDFGRYFRGRRGFRGSGEVEEAQQAGVIHVRYPLALRAFPCSYLFPCLLCVLQCGALVLCAPR
jgi:hypothetical protein